MQLGDGFGDVWVVGLHKLLEDSCQDGLNGLLVARFVVAEYENNRNGAAAHFC